MSAIKNKLLDAAKDALYTLKEVFPQFGCTSPETVKKLEEAIEDHTHYFDVVVAFGCPMYAHVRVQANEVCKTQEDAEARVRQIIDDGELGELPDGIMSEWESRPDCNWDGYRVVPEE